MRHGQTTLKDYHAYEATNILATLLESQFDRDFAHQWSIYASD